VRRLLIAACWLLVLGAIAAGVAISSRLGPDRLRAELVRRLTEAVGPVEVDSLRPYFGWGVGIELEGVRSVAAGEVPAFAADRVWVTLAPRSLLRGEVRARRVDVRGLRLRAALRDGKWEPPLVARLVARVDAEPDASAPLALPHAETDLRAFAQALPALSIEDGEVRIEREHDGRTHEIALRDLYFELTHDALGGAPKAGVAARLFEAEQRRGAIDLEATIERAGPSIDAAVIDADLAALAPWLRFGDVRVDAAGRVSGTAAWRPAKGGGALVLDLLGFDLDLSARRGDGSPVAGVFPTARLHAATEIDARALHVTKLEWSAEPVALAGSASIERPFRDAAKLEIDMRGGPISLAALRDVALALTPKDSPVRARISALRAGTLEDFSLRADPTSISAWRALADAPLDAWPASLAIETGIAGAEIALAGSAPLRELGARVRVRDDRIEIDDARAKRSGLALPVLTLRLTGMRAVGTALAQSAASMPVPSLPGLGALDDWIESNKRPGSPPRWRTIDVDAEWIEHPILLRPIEEFTARLKPANPGVHFEDAKGFWGGVPFQGTASIRGGDKASVDVDLTLTLPRREGKRRADSELWCRGRFRADLEKLGDFQAEELTGTVQGIGERVEMRHGVAKLRPRGDVTGLVDLDLSRADAVPYHARIELVNGSLSELMSDLKMDGGAANGTAEIDTELDGVLIAHRNLLRDASGPVAVRLRDGEILKRMNVLFSIAQASDTLNPFRSRETIPYDRIDAPLQFGGGHASTDGLSLQGDALRLVGTGRVNLVDDPHEVEAVIGIFYFRALDRVIGVFPLLNHMLLGPDDNLVSTYFAVAGPWSDPRASIIPSKSIASGPGSFMLEGFPSFVRGGLATLERLFTASEPPPEGAPTTEGTP
jgi:hypothetical protein